MKLNIFRAIVMCDGLYLTFGFFALGKFQQTQSLTSQTQFLAI